MARLRNRKHVISLSGGLASAASAIIAKEEGLWFEMVFADTLIEHPDLYRFIGELEEALGKKVIRLIDGRDPWQVFVDRKFIGNSRTAHCSENLKTQQVAEWMEANAFHHDPLVLGMYRDEEERLDRARIKWGVQEITSLLIEYRVNPGEANEMVKGYVPVRPRLYDLGFPHNNCGGMCVRSGQGQFALLLETRPDFYMEQEERNVWAEDALRALGSNPRGFIRVVRNGDKVYLNMREFRLAVQSGDLIPARHEMGGCGCFVDDGVDDI